MEKIINLPDQLQELSDFFLLGWGQSAPSITPGNQWVMSNNALYYNLRTLSSQLQAIQATAAAQQALLQEFATGAAVTSAKIVALSARLDLVQAQANLIQAQLQANDALDAQEDARLTSLEIRQLADEAARVAQLQVDAHQQAALDLLQAKQTADEALISAAQLRADNAYLLATSATASALAATTKANLSADAAALAQVTATNAAANAASLATTLSSVQTDVANRLPTSSIRRVQASVSGSLTLAAPIQVPVSFTPFADNAYEVFLTKANGGLLNTELGFLNKTPGGFTLTVRNTSLATLTLATSQVDIFVIHL